MSCNFRIHNAQKVTHEQTENDRRGHGQTNRSRSDERDHMEQTA